MPDDLLQIKNLNISFRTENGFLPAVQNLSISIPAGKTLGLVGESGSGKTVTSLSILNLLPLNSCKIEGEILFAGTNILQLSEGQLQSIRGRKVSMIFQEPMTSLNPVFTVGEQIQEVLRLHENMSSLASYTKTLELLEEVGISPAKERLGAYPHELSGGQKQRVMIAMAIACKPALLIADEPTTALDVTVQKQILDLLSALQKKYNMSLLFITHDLGVIAHIADQVAVMREGRLVEQGPAQKIFKDPQHAYTKSLLSCRPSPAHPTHRLAMVSDFLDEAGKEKAFDVEALGKKSDMPLTEKNSPLLEVQNLCTYFPIKSAFFKKTMGQIKAVDNVSLKVFKGRTLGIVGESGSGKTTLGRSLLRLIEPTAGKIFFQGKDITRLSESQLRPQRKNMQIIFQDPYASLNPRMTVGRAMTEAMQVHSIGSSSADRNERAEILLAKVGLEHRFLKRHPHEFSGGQRQRICIARALAVDPSFIVCDESVSALDVSVQAQILNLLLDLKEEFNLTYIFISHDLAAVRFFADEVVVMQEGRIVEYGSATEVYGHPKQDYTKKLLQSIINL